MQIVLRLLKTVRVKPQRPAVLRDVPHNLVRRPLWDFGPDFERDFDAGTDDAGEMLNHLLGDLRCVSSKPHGI